MNLKKDVLWIFSHPDPEKIPSYVLSGILPANFLTIQKIIFLIDDNPEDFLLKFRPKVIIINKAFHINIPNLIKKANELDIKVISIFDDWFFSQNSSNYDRLTLNSEIAKYSDLLIAKTKQAAKIIEKNTSLSVSIISDCIRYIPNNTISKIRYPFEICWFGMHTNYDTLILGLQEISKHDFDCNLTIITNNILELQKIIKKIKLNKTKINYIKWTEEANKIIIKSDIVIIPYIDDEKRKVKSQNRIIESMNLGKFVITSDVELTKEFKNFCYIGEIGDGLAWIIENKELTISMINNGSKYVKENYTIEAISKQWLNKIYSIAGYEK